MIPWPHLSPQLKEHLDRLSRFTQMTAECPYALQWDAPPPSKLPFPMGDLDTHLYMVAWANPSSQPNGISIGSAVFAGLTNVTDRPTDHATRSVTMGRIYVRSTGDAA